MKQKLLEMVQVTVPILIKSEKWSGPKTSILTSPDPTLEENSNFFSSIKIWYSKLLFFISLLFININQKSDLFKKMI